MADPKRLEHRRSLSEGAAVALRRDSETVGLGRLVDSNDYDDDGAYTQDRTYESQQQTTFNESIDVIHDSHTLDSMGIGSMAYGSGREDGTKSEAETSPSKPPSTFNESIDVMAKYEDSIIDSQVITKPLKKRVSSLECDSVDTSIPGTVLEINKMSFRALADHIRGPAKRMSQIDSESCSLFPDAASSQKDDVSGRKIDEIMNKIMQCKKKSMNYSPKAKSPQHQTPKITLPTAKSTTAPTMQLPPPNKLPPPPPRRATEIPTPILKKQPEKSVSPPPSFPPPPRPIQVNDTKLNSLPNNPSSRPHPPLSSSLRKHASTGAVPDNDLRHTPVSPMNRKKDPIDHILSQLELLEPPSPNNAHQGFVGSMSQENHDHEMNSPLNRRNTTGATTARQPGRTDLQAGQVHDMSYRDTKGGHGVYSGEVDQWGRPHGSGRIEYESGDFFEGRWINGEPFHEPSFPQGYPGVAYPQGFQEGAYPQGAGVMNHPSMYGGMMLPQASFNNGNFNMSMNSFNNNPMNFNNSMSFNNSFR